VKRQREVKNYNYTKFFDYFLPQLKKKATKCQVIRKKQKNNEKPERMLRLM
jgi:hypothetical protein